MGKLLGVHLIVPWQSLHHLISSSPSKLQPEASTTFNWSQSPTPHPLNAMLFPPSGNSRPYLLGDYESPACLVGVGPLRFPTAKQAQLKLERMQQKAEQEQARLEAQKKAEKVRCVLVGNTWSPQLKPLFLKVNPSIQGRNCKQNQGHLGSRWTYIFFGRT